MKQSALFTKASKESPKDETSINAKLLIRAGFINKEMAGVYTILPLGLRVMKKIEQIIREEMNNIGGQEIYMPSLNPKENWEKTGRWSTMTDLYKIKDLSDREYALAPTHEEIVAPLVKKFANSYKDLPVYVYQFQNKFRMELRAKSGILRAREFIMKDFYSFHLSENDLNEYYERAKNAYIVIFERCGIGALTHVTFASGGSFSKYSHEFQTITKFGEDIIYICTKCALAINKEIKPGIEECPDCGGKEFKEEKAVEVGNIFKLQNKYTAPFDFSVLDEKGQKKEVIMGCYGMGLGRVMGTIVECFNDEKGMIWPEEVAPFKVHILSLNQNKESEKIYELLLKNNIETLFDDRDSTAGVKFAEADLFGIPYQVIVSEKNLKESKLEIKERKSGNISYIDMDNKKILEFFRDQRKS